MLEYPQRREPDDKEDNVRIYIPMDLCFKIIGARHYKVREVICGDKVLIEVVV